MNRRSFLKGLGLVTVAAAAPKLIFDLGANKRIYSANRQVVFVSTGFGTAIWTMEQLIAARIEAFNRISGITDIHRGIVNA